MAEEAATFAKARAADLEGKAALSEQYRNELEQVRQEKDGIFRRAGSQKEKLARKSERAKEDLERDRSDMKKTLEQILSQAEVGKERAVIAAFLSNNWYLFCVFIEKKEDINA